MTVQAPIQGHLLAQSRRALAFYLGCECASWAHPPLCTSRGCCVKAAWLCRAARGRCARR